MVLTSPVTLFVLPKLSDKSDIRLLNPKQKDAQITQKVLFKTLPKDFSITAYECVERPEDADFFIVPQAVKTRTPIVDQYLDQMCEVAREHEKKIIVFLTGDLCHKVHIDRPEVIVLLGSLYSSSCRKNEVVFAPFTEDLGEQRSPVARSWKKTPVISFCGYAGFPSLQTRLKYYFVNFIFDLIGKSVYKRGIFYRRRAITALEKDTRVATSFVIRDSFSGNANTLSVDSTTARQEYLDNIVNSDYVLCPKGDANFSCRFYETLSLGRLPILIDTEMRLPLQETTDYSFVVRVPYTEIARIADYVSAFHAKLDEAAFRALQDKARSTYLARLRFDSYFNTMLPLLKKGDINSVI